MTGSALRELVARVERVLPAKARVKVGVEAAGHYHLPLLAPATWPAGWEVLEFNPAHVTEQRRVMGRRWLKTDAIDLEAITELLLAGRGAAVTARQSVLGELAAWSAHRTRRVAIRTATKNQLLGHLDRSFPGLTLALPDVLGTRIGRLVAAEFADPARWPRSVRTGWSASPPPATFSSAGRSPSGWSPPPGTPCPPPMPRSPGRCWPPT
jgi:transposase